MSKIAIVMGAMILGGGAFALVLQRADNARLRKELAMLRAEVQVALAARREAPKPVAPPTDTAPLAVVTPERSDPGAGDLASLREEIAGLRRNLENVGRLGQLVQTKQALESASTIPDAITPTAALKNAGRQTPEAATETLLWAAAGGDVDTLAAGLVLAPAAKARADAWFAGLPEATRREYGSPEKVMALLIARDAAKLGGMQILGQRALSPEAVGVRMRFADTEGNVKDDNFLLHQGGDGWRLVLPEASVEKFARQLAGRR